jgi:hypothetical protein
MKLDRELSRGHRRAGVDLQISAAEAQDIGVSAWLAEQIDTIECPLQDRM